MGTVGYESNNWVTRAISLLIRVGKSYQRLKDSLAGRIIAYYASPRPKRQKKSRNDLY